MHSQLPVKIDIIKHPNETDGKSTAVHAKLIAPNDVNIYTYPCIPDLDGDLHKVSVHTLNMTLERTNLYNDDFYVSSHTFLY